MKKSQTLFSSVALERKWFKCPACGQNLLIYDNTGKANGIYMKCKKCKKEIEIKI